MKCTKYQLKNGMTVLFVPSHKSPVVSVQMWVRTGSADESKGLEGISHFIEHLVFKGSEKYGVGQIASVVEGSGGELNAYTSFDQTVFYVTISKNFTETGLDVISQMMGHPKFDQVEIDNEREVVIEEIRRGLDSPGRKSSQLLFKNIFAGHPYSIPVIGYEKVIRKVSRKSLMDYYNSRYVPENMFLVIAGDFESKEMKGLVNQYFGSFKKFKLKRVKRKKLSVFKGPKISLEKSKFLDDQIFISFRTPGAKHKDIAALDLAGLILGQGDSSRLVHKLRIEDHLVQGVGCSTYSPNDAGVFSFSFGLKSEQAEKAFPAACQVIQGFLENPASEDELKKAHVSFESEMIFSTETVDSLARRFGHLEFLYNDPNFAKKYLDLVKKVDWKTLRSVTKKYLNPKNMVITGLSHNPELVKKHLKSFIKSYSKSYDSAFGTKQSLPKIKKVKIPKLDIKTVSKTENAIEKTVLKNGITLLTRHNSDTALLSVRSCYMGGVRIEPQDKYSVVELAARSWVSKTSKLNEQEIYQLLESSASGISAFSGRNTIGMSYDGLTAFEKEVAPVFIELLTSPKVEASIFEREKQVLLNQIKSRSDSPGQQVMLKLNSEIFAGHPYAKDMTGTIEQASATTLADVEKYFFSLMTAENLTISISGSFNKDFWIELLSKIQFSKPGTRLSQKFEQKAPTEEKIFFKELDREQTHIALAFKGLTLSSEDKYALDLISSILSGQGGRLFVELRDKNSLAYSVSPLKMDGIDAGYFGAYIACSPEKTKKAIEMMKAELKKLANDPVPQDELERAKQYIIGRHDIDLQKNNTISMAMLMEDVYGLNFKEIFNIAPKYLSVTAKDIQAVAKRLFSTNPVLSIVGPKSSLSEVKAQSW